MPLEYNLPAGFRQHLERALFVPRVRACWLLVGGKRLLFAYKQALIVVQNVEKPPHCGRALQILRMQAAGAARAANRPQARVQPQQHP